MVNVFLFIDKIVNFMGAFISMVRDRFTFVFGFVEVNFFDIILVVLITTMVINVLWKGGRA